MKKFSGIIFFIIISAIAAAAHPLGNFSVNQFSRVEVEASQIKLRSVLDIAEIPTFQLKIEIDADKDGNFSTDELNAYAAKITPEHLSNLSLTVDGNPVALRVANKTIELREGAGGLPTTRIVWDFVGDLPSGASDSAHSVKFENKNFTDRIGWNEIVVGRTSGINIFNSSAKGSGLTDELKTYPQESLIIPLDERKAEFSFTASTLPTDAQALKNRDGHQTAPVEKDRFAELINVPEVTPSIIFFGLLLALGLGAMHALSPGHGKTVVGAYLVGSRGTMKHAIFLGLTVTITHTLGVFALGLITLFASNYILPERLMPFLGFISGLMVFFIGVTMFKERLFAALGWKKTAATIAEQADEFLHDEPLTAAVTHTHGGSTHTHLPPKNVSWKSLLALGISGGLLPCPSALVLMLSAISIGRIGYGLVLTVAFSFGLAATLTAVGLAFLYVGKAFGGSRLSENRLVKLLPVFSAFIITCVGAVICYNSI